MEYFADRGEGSKITGFSVTKTKPTKRNVSSFLLLVFKVISEAWNSHPGNLNTVQRRLKNPKKKITS